MSKRQMLLWPIRKLIDVAIHLALATLLLFSLFVYAPGGALWQLPRYDAPQPGPISIESVRRLCAHCSGDPLASHLAGSFNLHMPWPSNYVSYILNPSDTIQFTDDYNYMPKGLDIGIGALKIVGSGAITGEMGRSFRVAKAVPVSELVGYGWGEIIARLIIITIGLYAIAVLQRQSQQAYHVPPSGRQRLSLKAIELHPTLYFSDGRTMRF